MEMNIKSVIESLLYVAGQDGVEISDIKRVLNIPTDEIRNYLKDMQKDYASNVNRGLNIEFFGDKWYLLTKKENKDFIANLFDINFKNPLSRSMLEALAVIAYNSPCPKSKIEQICGHNATNTIKRLMDLDLIHCVGQASTPGLPYLYEITSKFFNLFGIKSIKELPNIENDFDKDITTNSEDFFSQKINK